MDERGFVIPDELWKIIEAPENRLILVIGASDTGKTTFIETIAGKFSSRFRLAIVDLDMGQSHIGPPTTIGWARIPVGFKDLSSLKEEEFYFTGTVTPLGSLLPAITGARLMADRAMGASDKVIVDTTGLVSEPAGRVLKHYKIEILRPDLIICLERADELSHIKEPFRLSLRHLHQVPRFYTLKPSSEVRQKSPSERQEYRYRLMETYLEGSEIKELKISDLGFLFTGERINFDNSDLKNRIVSLRDFSNRDMGLGVVELVKPKEGKIYIRAKELPQRPVTIVIGKAVMDRKERTLRNVSALI